MNQPLKEETISVPMMLMKEQTLRQVKTQQPCPRLND